MNSPPAGMERWTIRDHLALEVLHLFGRNEELMKRIVNHEFVARFCYELADAFLKERTRADLP